MLLQMEILKMIKKIIALSIVVLIALVFCSVPVMAVDLIASGGGDAGIIVGEVDVSYAGDCMLVEITTDAPWVLGDSHVAVADDCTNIPQTKKGNARVGKFPYSSGVCISLAEEDLDPGDTVCIAAHAEVTNPDILINEVLPLEESAWGEGDGLPGSDWSMCFCSEVPEL